MGDLTHQALRTALAHYQAGRYAEAEAGYRAVLKQQPDQPDALHILSQLASLAGRMSLAIELAERAVAIDPASAPYQNTLGRHLARLGRMEQAHGCFVRALELDPQLAESHNNRGNTLRVRSQLPEAIAAYRRAIALQPDYPDAHYNLSNALRDAGHIAQAIAGYEKAMPLPDKPALPL